MNTKIKIPVGTELTLKSKSERTGWKLVQYVTDDIICIEASDGKQIQTYVNNVNYRFASQPIRSKN